MIVPYRHIAELAELSDEEITELMNELKSAQRALGETLKPQGFNIGANLGRSSGAGIADHLHFHIVPRWNGDTNFMPVIGDIKVMPEYIKKTYDKLLKGFSKDQ